MNVIIQRKNIELINNLIENHDLNDSIKFEYYMLALHNLSFESFTLNNFIQFINSTNSEVISSEFSSICKAFNDNTTNTYLLKKLNVNISLTIDVFKSIFLELSNLLNLNFQFLLIKETSLTALQDNNKFWTYLTTTILSQEIIDLLFLKITNVKEFTTISSFIAHRGQKDNYINVTQRLTDSVRNFTDLINLHDIPELTGPELNIIKKCKLKNFGTSSTTGLTKIHWNKNEVIE